MFPVLSALSLVVFFVGGVLALAAVVVAGGVAEGEVLEGYWWLGTLAVGYFVAAVLSTYFNAGLVNETTRALRGETPSVRSGLAAGWRVRRKVLVWGVVGSAFGVVIELLETSNNRFAWVVSTLLQGSWAVLTFFVVPVMLFTDTGVRGMFEESARTFRDVWGESLTASLGVDLLSALGFLAVVAAVLLAGVALPASAGALFGVVLAVGLLLLVALLVVRAAAHAVGKAALYEYATTGTVPDLLEDVDVGGLASDATAEP